MFEEIRYLNSQEIFSYIAADDLKTMKPRTSLESITADLGSAGTTFYTFDFSPASVPPGCRISEKVELHFRRNSAKSIFFAPDSKFRPCVRRGISQNDECWKPLKIRKFTYDWRNRRSDMGKR